MNSTLSTVTEINTWYNFTPNLNLFHKDKYWNNKIFRLSSLSHTSCTRKSDSHWGNSNKIWHYLPLRIERIFKSTNKIFYAFNNDVWYLEKLCSMSTYLHISFYSFCKRYHESPFYKRIFTVRFSKLATDYSQPYLMNTREFSQLHTIN